MPKPSFGGNRGYDTTAIGSALDHQIIYGRMRVSGARIYDEATGTNNKFLHRIIAVAGHEFDLLTVYTLTMSILKYLLLRRLRVTYHWFTQVMVQTHLIGTMVRLGSTYT